MSQLVQLRRRDTGTPWGFRMNGGAEYGEPLYVIKVSPQSVALRAGMRDGDGILQINQTPTVYMRHDQAKMEIIRSGNEVDFIVQRGLVAMPSPPQPAAPAEPSAPAGREDRTVIITEEKPSWHSQNPQVQSRSFKILQAAMEAEGELP